MYRQSETSCETSVSPPYVPTMWWTSAHYRQRVVGAFGAPQQISTAFACCLRYCSDVAQRKPYNLCTVFGRLLDWYTIYTFSAALAPWRNFEVAKFTLRPSFAFFCIGSVTAGHSSSRRLPNFAALRRGRHLHSAERLPRWVSAHILVLFKIVTLYKSFTYLLICMAAFCAVPSY